jgi:chromatin segregation and condensation protein Rec8/ScpA/Scc1 (kleisin family)
MTEIDDSKLIQTIVVGRDWQEILTTIIVEDGMDPLNIDITHLADKFMTHLTTLQKFDFRVPGRFILIASILLRMKCETMLDEDIKKEDIKGEEIPPLDISNVPDLTPPIMRKPTRKVTLTELIGALNKAFEFREKKEIKKFNLVNRVERLIEPEEDIEEKIQRVMNRIVSREGTMTLRDIVPDWNKRDIVDTFLPVLYLSNRGTIHCEQEEMFSDIKIRVIE